jgi:hypothetical protein
MLSRQRILAAFIAVAGLLAGGCSSGPKTYSVKGKVDHSAGEVSALTDVIVEASLESDPTVRASGSVQSDGSFTLETLHAGVIYKGALEGKYQVRFILPDDDKEARRKAVKALDPRFLKFETSDLSLQVPPNGEVVLKVGPKK